MLFISCLASSSSEESSAAPSLSPLFGFYDRLRPLNFALPGYSLIISFVA